MKAHSGMLPMSALHLKPAARAARLALISDDRCCTQTVSSRCGHGRQQPLQSGYPARFFQLLLWVKNSPSAFQNFLQKALLDKVSQEFTPALDRGQRCSLQAAHTTGLQHFCRTLGCGVCCLPDCCTPFDQAENQVK